MPHISHRWQQQQWPDRCERPGAEGHCAAQGGRPAPARALPRWLPGSGCHPCSCCTPLSKLFLREIRGGIDSSLASKLEEHVAKPLQCPDQHCHASDENTAGLGKRKLASQGRSRSGERTPLRVPVLCSWGSAASSPGRSWPLQRACGCPIQGCPHSLRQLLVTPPL